MRRSVLVCIAVLFPVTGVLQASSALAGPLAKGQFGGSIAAGADVSVGGNLHDGVTTASLPLSAVAPLLTPVPTLPATATGAQLRIGRRAFDKTHDTGYRVQADLAYGLGGGTELLGGLSYVRLGAKTLQVGTAALLNAAGTQVGGEVPVFGRFSDYSAVSVEGGVRQYFGHGAIQPFAAGRLGVAFVDKINANFTIPALNLTNKLNGVRFYGNSTVFTAGADAGLSFGLSKNASLDVEAGIRYAGKLSSDNRDIAPLGLASIDKTGARISLPISARLRFGF